MIKLPQIRNPFAPERGKERINYFRFGRTLFDGFAMVIVDEQITLDSEVTQYAVETGSHISDHIKPLPARIVYNGMVSNDNNRQGATQAWHRLTAAFKDREPVTVFGSVDIFDNMVLESIQLQREGANALEVSLSLVQIREVEPESVETPEGISSKPEAKPKTAETKQNRGAVQPVEIQQDQVFDDPSKIPSMEVPEVKKSILKRASEGVGDGIDYVSKKWSGKK